MKHYRILEKKGEKKEYKIQYLKKLIFGLHYWKKNNNIIYYKYEDAFNEVKQLIVQIDYDNLEFGYHYIDAYKIFKTPSKTITSPISPTLTTPTINVTKVISESRIKTKASFVPKNSEKKISKSVFIPKNK